MENLIILAGLRASHFVLVAVGFALVLGSSRVLNLMHGSYVMLGAYATYAFSILLKQAGVPMVVPLVTKRSSKPPRSSCRRSRSSSGAKCAGTPSGKKLLKEETEREAEP